jgi:hypothetical protein
VRELYVTWSTTPSLGGFGGQCRNECPRAVVKWLSSCPRELMCAGDRFALAKRACELVGAFFVDQ